MYAILYEWPRRTPPKWQHWLKFLSAEMGIAHQSGILIVRSKSAARAIMTVLSRGIEANGGMVKPSELALYALNQIDFIPSKEDDHFADKVLRKLSRKGRPIKERYLIVTCGEEGKSRRVYGSEVICCPECGSMNITVKEDM